MRDTAKIKREISLEFNIPIKSLSVRYNHGWHIIEIDKKEYREYMKDYRFTVKVDEIVKRNSDNYSTFLSDDGYGSDMARVLVNFPD